MPYITTDHHWMKIVRPSYTTITDLIDQDHFTPCRANLCGPRGDVQYKLASSSQIRVINDELLTIAGKEILAEMNHQPTIAYRAMVLASSQFEQYPDINSLLLLLRQDSAAWNPNTFAAALEEAVQEGRKPDTQPRLVNIPTTYQATWKPAETYILQTARGDWFLGLTYQTQYRPGRIAAQRVDVGLDVGYNPVAYAYTAIGQSQEFRVTALKQLNSLRGLSLSLPAQALLAHLAYACGRLDTEAVVAWLNYYANRVFSEKLTHDGMDKNYIFRARELAIHDYHFSNLSQYLHASQHFCKRVPSRNTSTYCPHCREKDQVLYLGQRNREEYICDRCGYTGNSHRVGAHNVLLNGWERYGAE